jgi:hypothetical protein
MVFTPHEPAPHQDEFWQRRLETLSNGGVRVTILWFLDRDPRECWNGLFDREVTNIGVRGIGRVELVAPFIPSKMGTTAYEDELRP